jgi:hypothetical protein
MVNDAVRVQRWRVPRAPRFLAASSDLRHERGAQNSAIPPSALA